MVKLEVCLSEVVTGRGIECVRNGNVGLYVTDGTTACDCI